MAEKERLLTEIGTADVLEIVRDGLAYEKELKEKLETGADKAAQKAVEEVIRGLRLYVIIDISASMQGALEAAKPLIAKLLMSIPKEQLHVSVFNTAGREVTIKNTSTKGVEASFRGIRAGGGTDYGAGVWVLSQYKPKEDEDALFLFIGDEEQQRTFEAQARNSGINPVAFAFLKTTAQGGAAAWRAARYETTAVRQTAANLGIPCVMIDERTFDDPYAIPRTLRTLIAATPVGVAKQARAPRVTLIDQIIQTDLLTKPAWA